MHFVESKNFFFTQKIDEFRLLVHGYRMKIPLQIKQ